MPTRRDVLQYGSLAAPSTGSMLEPSTLNSIQPYS